MQKKMYMIPQVEEVFFTPKRNVCDTPIHPNDGWSAFNPGSAPPVY